jgi:hypothetical protein
VEADIHAFLYSKLKGGELKLRVLFSLPERYELAVPKVKWLSFIAVLSTAAVTMHAGCLCDGSVVLGVSMKEKLCTRGYVPQRDQTSLALPLLSYSGSLAWQEVALEWRDVKYGVHTYRNISLKVVYGSLQNAGTSVSWKQDSFTLKLECNISFMCQLKDC